MEAQKVLKWKLGSRFLRRMHDVLSSCMQTPHAGMPFYRPPEQLPLDLNTGYTDSYVKKPEEESTPVEVIIEGARQLGAKLQEVQICTFR